MNIDNLKQIKKFDKSEVYKSIETLPDQIRQVLNDARLIKIPREYSKVNQVIVNGMGASNIGARIVKAVFSDQIKVPISITPGYSVPANVNKNTLYIISSYSGNTEEPLSVYKEVKKRGAKILGITSQSGNKLEKLMIKENIPGYIFKPEFNYSAVPRAGLGYGIFGTAVMLAKAGLFKIKIQETKDIIASLEIWDRELRPTEKINFNKAKKLAVTFFDKEPIAVGAEFLLGNLRVIRNQFCESSKNFAGYLTIPELNHYAMEGLEFPKNNNKNLIFFFIDSKLYHPRIQKRIALTKKIVKRNKIKYIDYKLISKTKLGQTFELLQLATWITYYLGILNKKNPATNPWVDWFKKNLS
ncbi:MAG TPA: SIS domain-containing protein [Candidatus Wolfebacteria bacterium]|nr:SIS domain-containing protein [Candidatus Wolfebacteria bacterium]